VTTAVALTVDNKCAITELYEPVGINTIFTLIIAHFTLPHLASAYTWLVITVDRVTFHQYFLRAHKPDFFLYINFIL